MVFTRMFKSVLILDNQAEAAAVAEIVRRLPFFLPGYRARRVSPGGWGGLAGCLDRWRRTPVLYGGQEDMRLAPSLLRDNPCYWLNPYTNSREAWEWHELVSQHTRPLPDIAAARARLQAYAGRHALREFGRAYVFGTGPSLERARERRWDDGVRIVCNTIVRDRELWLHLQPHFILAADAGYHFSMTRHAAAFREDLGRRLAETDTMFLYPAVFDAVVRRELAAHADRLVPVPGGQGRNLANNLLNDFEFPDLHNILPRLLIVAGTFADDIRLWGFDGRAPDARDFWHNSGRHSYPEHMAALKTAYPAFFEELVPNRDPTRYMRRAFGDELEEALAAAEAAGKRFIMLHDTYTEILQRRRPPVGEAPHG